MIGNLKANLSKKRGDMSQKSARKARKAAESAKSAETSGKGSRPKERPLWLRVLTAGSAAAAAELLGLDVDLPWRPRDIVLALVATLLVGIFANIWLMSASKVRMVLTALVVLVLLVAFAPYFVLAVMSQRDEGAREGRSEASDEGKGLGEGGNGDENRADSKSRTDSKNRAKAKLGVSKKNERAVASANAGSTAAALNSGPAASEAVALDEPAVKARAATSATVATAAVVVSAAVSAPASIEGSATAAAGDPAVSDSPDASAVPGPNVSAFRVKLLCLGTMTLVLLTSCLVMGVYSIVSLASGGSMWLELVVVAAALVAFAFILRDFRKRRDVLRMGLFLAYDVVAVLGLVLLIGLVTALFAYAAVLGFAS